VLAQHRIILLPLLFRSLGRKKKKKKKPKILLPATAPRGHAGPRDRQLHGRIGNSTASELEGEDNDATEQNEVGSLWMGMIGSSWTQSWPGVAVRPLPATGGWSRGYPWSMGRSRGHARGLGVAFGPTRDGSWVGPMATPSSARPPPATRGWPCGYPRSMGRPWATPGVWGWPEPRGGLRANPSIRALLSVRFSLAVTASSNPDNGSFRPGRCGPTWALVAFSDLGVAGSVQTHVGGVGVGLAVAACFDPVGGSVVQYGCWWRGLAWAVPAASSLAVGLAIFDTICKPDTKKPGLGLL
jgi:hypothetical protein